MRRGSTRRSAIATTQSPAQAQSHLRNIMADSTTPVTQSPAALSGAADGPAGQYVVIARRYRPQSFDELIGQEHVRQAMAGAIESQRVGHAYLFTGARGVGKTSSARILAKCLNCVHGPTANPCNDCEICRDISAGVDVDVLEIDGASNRGVDEIRQLRQNVAVRPSRARFKIYIIDEVHMLTREAFNALLKTLEEPPEHVKFIFCTTEPEKVPITIHSRCQRFDFAGIAPSAIVARLADICQHEGVDAEPAALEIIARRAAGSMRDSQSLLEQVLACCGKQLTADSLHKLLGTASGRRFAHIVEHLVARSTAAALAELDAAVAEGVDVGQLLEQLLGYFRDVMAAGVGCKADAFLHATSADEAQVRAAADRLGIESTLAVLQILDQTLARLRLSTHARTLAEIALVRICKLEDLQDLSTLIAAVRGGLEESPANSPASGGSLGQKKNLAEPQRAAMPSSPAPTATTHTPAARGEAPPMPEDEAPGDATSGVHADAPQASAGSTSIGSKTVTPLTPENAAALWQQTLASLSDMVADQAALYDRVTLAAENRLAVYFPNKYNSCKEFCQRSDQTAKLERKLAELTGRITRLEFHVDEPSAGATASRPTAQRARPSDRAQHPLVRRAMELFAATPFRIEEPADKPTAENSS
jgi:DNA polymerase-3 subunit gamma/tau